MIIANIVENLIGLIRLGMRWTDVDVDLINRLNSMSDSEWTTLQQMAGQQGVSAIILDGIEYLSPKIKVPHPTLVMLIALRIKIEQNCHYKNKALEKLCLWFSNAKIPILVIKGMALCRWYPEPTHRTYGDIDIYLGTNYKHGNEIIRKNGYTVEEDYYRHSHAFVDGTPVENHCWLSDQGVEGNSDFEQLLREYAEQSLTSGKIGVTAWPNANFNALFLSWHASAHFMFEEISLRQVIDWALFLLNESRYVDIPMFRLAKANFAFGKFADIMSALAFNYLKIPTENIPIAFIEDANKLNPSLIKKVFEHTISAKHRKHSKNKFLERFELVTFAWKDRWKYKEIYNMGFMKLLITKMKTMLSPFNIQILN